MKRLAGDEAIVIVPVVVEPVEVQVPLVTVPVEVRDVEVAVRVPQKYATHHPSHHPLNTQLSCILFGDVISPVNCTEYLHF